MAAGINWIDVDPLPFNVLLLLERIQLSWFPGWVPEREMSLALGANPAVAWYLRHKCPELGDWLDGLPAEVSPSEPPSLQAVRQAEVTILQSLNDLLVYVIDPALYDSQPFHGWDSEELLTITDFSGRTVIDVGAGTGRLALTVAPKAASVFAVEPVTNLRRFLKAKAAERGLRNVFAVDGLITELPFPDRFADVTMGGHVFGDRLEEEYRELQRVTKRGGMVVLCPGNNDTDNAVHEFLVSRGCLWSRFEEPQDGMKRKYWQVVAAG